MTPSKPIVALIIFVIVVSLMTETYCWDRRRRRRRRRRACSPRNCQVSSWSSWSACSTQQCGVYGTKWRYRNQLISASCGGSCPYNMRETTGCHGSTPVNCRVSPWSSWSLCSAIQCGITGSQHRSRSIVTYPACGGTPCPSNMQDTATCYGTTAVNCGYSTWSTWNACPSSRCGGTQTSRRHIITGEQCGGTPCNMTALRKTRLCKQTFCVNQGTLLNGKCFCKAGYYGSCCQYNSDRQPCPYGQTGTSLATCSDGPQMFPKRYLGHPNISIKPGTEERICLLCTVKLDAKIKGWKNVTYIIKWFVDGKPTKPDEIKDQLNQFCVPLRNKSENANSCPGDKIASELCGGMDGDYHPGQWLSCEVKAKFTAVDRDYHPWCEPVPVVEPFFAGVKVSPSTLIIEECKEPYYKNITLAPTIPVRIQATDGLHVRFFLPKGFRMMNTDNCTINLQDLTPKIVPVGVTCAEVKTFTKWAVITPRVLTTDVQSMFWGGFGLPTVWVVVITDSQPIRVCKSVTDPHHRSLREKSKISVHPWPWRDFHGYGSAYVLYRNEEKSFEVQTKQWGCGDFLDPYRVTCNCAAVIRDHHHVIRFDRCNSDMKRNDTTQILVDIPSAPHIKCLPPGISLNKTNKGHNILFEVIVPSGIRVEIERNYWGIDITIYTPKTKKEGDETGLCTYKDKDGDFIEFGKNQGIWPSYFEILPKKSQNIDDLGYERSCACDKTTGKGSEKEQCVDGIPATYQRLPTKKFGTPTHICDWHPQKRDIEWSDDLTKEDIEYFRTPYEAVAHSRQKRSLSPITKENATRYCAERLAETRVGKLCAKLGTDVQALVNVCAVDIQSTGDFSFAIGAASLLMSECGDVIIENITLTSNETNNLTTPTMPPVLEETADLLCPNDCAFNGECVNGSCVCHKDYTAVDCSMSIYQMPSIYRLQSKGLCDRRKRPCKKVSLLGTGFLNSENLTCHIKEVKVVNGSWIPNTNETKFPGIMTDLVLVECFLPDSPVLRTQYDGYVEGTPAAGLEISVSNNGADKSDQKLKLISYDSVCMECNVTTGCVLKKNTCLINRYCFAPNDPNPRDWCQQCLPRVNKNTWTKREVNYPPNVTSTTNYYVVYEEMLELPIESSDPEGMPITISLMEGSPKEAVVLNNVLLWNVTTNKTTRFFFKATDACQASSTLNITITVNVCPCNNNGRCTPRKPRGRGFYICSCTAGFTGQNCDSEIDECQSFPCLRGRCTDLVNNYTCDCDLGFEGRNCDVGIDYCKSSPCLHGNCTDEVNGYHCLCEAGYSGLQCEVNIDECGSSPCANNGVCVDQVNSYACQCQAGFTGVQCEVDVDECQSSPCVNNGSCFDQVNGFRCTCQAGFSGLRCEENINECLEVSCGNGTCVDQVNNYSCVCNVGYTGRHCDVLITHCSNDTCYPGVPCTENIISISCGSCPSGFTGDGKICKDVDDCANQTCRSHGSCVDGINSHTCHCLMGFTGSHCGIDIDDCVNHTCANGGSCVDGLNNYSCNCTSGYTGNDCENDIDDCVNHTCANGGFCIDGVNKYMCNCSSGFTGRRCENDINDCLNVTCENGGSCMDGINNFTCSCQAGYTGRWCETDIDDCVSNKCANGSTCLDGVDQYTCLCQEGFTGKLCKIERLTTASTATDSGTTKTSTSESTSGLLSTTSTIEETKSDFAFEIRVLEEWDDRLRDKRSEKFKELANLMKAEIWKAYSGIAGLKEVEVISMRPGSIITEFHLKFKTKLTAKEALAPLKRKTASGKLGSLGVDPSSIKPMIATKQDTEGQSKSTTNLPFIIGVSCGSFVLLAVIAICIVVYCKRDPRSHIGSGVGDGMPGEEAYPKREKYELKQVGKNEENVVWMEEKGLRNEGMEQVNL